MNTETGFHRNRPMLMHMKTPLVTLSVLLLTAATAFALTPKERAFLGPDGLADRIATLQPLSNGAATESVVTNQGGNSAKPCDATSISANTMTVVSSDNAGPVNGIIGPWQQWVSGFVTLYNPRTSPVVVTVDEFYGDQTAAAAGNGVSGSCSGLDCYYNSTLANYLRIPAQDSIQVPFVVVDTVPLDPALDKDWMAYYLTITASAQISCTANSYVTTEHN